jgi:hypothetical protein
MSSDDEAGKRRSERFVETGEGIRIVRPGVGTFRLLDGKLVLEQAFEEKEAVEFPTAVSSSWPQAADDLIAFWSRLDDGHIHPDDASRVTETDFATDLHPVPWAGPLRTAKVYFLFLNPGLSEDDRIEEARPAFKAALQANLAGDKPYFYLLKEHASHPGYRWARQTFGKDITEAFAGDVCMLQLVPYHSKEGAAASKVAPTLPSSLAIRRFVQEGLLPRARTGEIGIVVARSARLWGVQKEEDGIVVYGGAEPRRAFQTSGSRGGQLLRQILKAAS